MRYTESAKVELFALLQNGWSLPEAAREVGAHYSTVKRWVGVPPERRQDRQRAELLKLYTQGIASREAANRLGINYHTARRWLRQCVGRTYERRYYDKATVAMAKALGAKGYGVRDVCARMDLSERTVTRWLSEP